MRSKDLERWQLEKIKDPVGTGLGYLTKLCRRIDQTMTPDDPLYQAAYKAHAAMQSLYVTLHYLGCSGVGQLHDSTSTGLRQECRSEVLESGQDRKQ